MNCTTSSVESERFGLLPSPFIEESWLTTHSAPFSKVPILAQLRARQSMFISMLLGGRIVYTGKDIHAVHAHAREQGLNDGHFDRFLRHFREALSEVGVEAQRVEKVTKLLESKRNAVLYP
jgi:truncated hemoglobin YjbI